MAPYLPCAQLRNLRRHTSAPQHGPEHCKRPIQAVQQHECPNKVERQRSGCARDWWTLPTMRRRAFTRFGRPRHVSAVREFLARGSVGRGRAVLSPARLCLRQLLLGAAERVRQPERHIPRVRLLLIVLHDMGRSRAALLRDDQVAARPHGRQPRGRAGKQRRLPFAALPAAGRAGARHRAGGERCRKRGRQRCPDAHRILWYTPRTSAHRRGPPSRPHRRQQRSRPGAGPK